MPSFKCMYSGCHMTSNDKRLHRFPKDTERCRLWVQACNNTALFGISANILYNKCRVCEDHFMEWHYMNPGERRRLVHDAVPVKSPGNSDSNHKEIVQFEENSAENLHPSAGKQSILLSNDEQIIPDSENQSFGENAVQPVMCLPNTCNNICDNLYTVCKTPEVKSKPTSRIKYTPKRRQLVKSLKNTKDCLHKMKKRNACNWSSLFNCKKSTRETLQKNLLNEGVNKNLVNFIVRQIKLNKNKDKGRRYTNAEKLFAYNIFCKSRAAYRVLRNLLMLPSESTLHSFISSKLSSPGLNLNILKSLENAIKTKPQSQIVYVLIFDEMAIKPSLIYNASDDSVSGFEHFGPMESTQRIANQVLVLMIRSLKGNKKLPLGFFFSKSAVSSFLLKEILTNAIDKLQKIGISIKAVICDQGSNNCKLFSLLGISIQKPFFTINNEKIYGIYDPPHLKSIRRNIMKYNIKTSKGLVSFDHVKDFYNFDKIQSRRCAHKLTDWHIYAEGMQSMNVKLAAQVFSNTVAAGMSLCMMAGIVKPEATTTIEFISLFNDLFDSVNGTSVKAFRGKKYQCAAQSLSPHFELWQNTIKEISSWQLVSKNEIEKHPTKRKKIANPRCFTGWQLTLQSMIFLFNDLKDLSFQFLLTKCLNQDCLENLFSLIQGTGGYRSNPTAYEFQSSFKVVCVNIWTRTHKFANCEDDGDHFIIDLIECSDEVNFNNRSKNAIENGPYFKLFEPNTFPESLRNEEACNNEESLCNLRCTEGNSQMK